MIGADKAATKAGSTQPILALLAIGAAWGMTIPLAKIAVEAGLRPFGIIAVEMVVGLLILAPLVRATGQRLSRTPRALLLFVMVACLGTLVPNTASYLATDNLPAGVMAIIIAIVPMFAMPIAAFLGLEPVRLLRVLGVLAGAIGILTLVGPSASLPDPAMAPWVLVALIGPFCYGWEGNLLALRGTEGMGAMAVLLGSMVFGAIVMVPLALGTGQMPALLPLGPGQWAVLAMTILHVGAYAGYVWLVGRAGSVFASQVAYLVTLFGVGWSIVILGESYSGWIWAALALMLVGIALVRPR